MEQNKDFVSAVWKNKNFVKNMNNKNSNNDNNETQNIRLYSVKQTV